MKASTFSDAQKAFILKQGNDGVPVPDICRKAGMVNVILRYRAGGKEVSGGKIDPAIALQEARRAGTVEALADQNA